MHTHTHTQVSTRNKSEGTAHADTHAGVKT